MDDREKRFEQDIETYLLNEGGYTKGSMATFDKDMALDLTTLISFIDATQPKVWQRYKNAYGAKADQQLYVLFQNNVSRYGLLHVLRNGVKDVRGGALKFCYFAPASNLNPELTEKYNQNILTVTRQFYYSKQNRNSVDMVLSLNGIPVVALELKNQFKNQSIEEGKKQFREDRSPKELIFNFNSRILVYFAADLYEVAMTTHLKGMSTYFLPFNQGSNGPGNIGDGGNPTVTTGYATSYLWEKVLRRDMLLSLLQRYISLEESESLRLENGEEKKETSTKLIFPRYHQLDVVEKLIADTRTNLSGKNYLIQHSAGSGKSNSIAWLTYRLASLHDEDDRNIFQTVFVVTDRRNLNKQLQDTILGFDHIKGQIEVITDKDNSSKLRDAINDKKRIIITTLHRFPLIYKELDSHTGKNFAILIDEAHSSQSGKSAEKLKAALADTEEALKELAELEEKEEEALKDEMDLLTETLLTQGQHRNLSFYAFTATPKPKTLETFGVLRSDGAYDAFHHYSMRQAIDEHFIEDVLKYYTTLQTAYEVAKSVSDNPAYEEMPATIAIKRYHDNHEFTLKQKTEVIVEKFREITLKRMQGKAKAMLVTPSRAHAVRYFFLIKEYCREKGYEDVMPLVAFSGSIKYRNKEYTETKLNSTTTLKVTEAKLPLYFASDRFNLLIVADKYQTGFDEPLLHTMFVDKKLRGIKAVQTLNRPNRCHPLKQDTYILDFVNTGEEIQKSFLPFYEDTLLGESIDLNLVYTFKQDLQKYHLWCQEDEDKLFEIYSTRKQGDKDLGKFSNVLKGACSNYNVLPEDTQFKIRSLLKNFNRFYAYMAQIVRSFDRDLLKTYLFTEYLYKVLPKTAHDKVNLDDQIALISSRIEQTFTGSISLAPTDKDKKLKGEKAKNGHLTIPKKDTLENIINKINVMYAGNFTEADRVIVETIYDKLQANSNVLKRQVNNSDPNMFEKNIFPKEFSKIAQTCYMEQMDSFAKLFKNPEFYEHVMKEMASAMYHSLINK